MTLAGQIAERIHALRFEDITPTALEWTGTAFIDTLGVTLAGIMEEAPRILLRLPGVAGPGPVAYYDYDYYPEWDVYYYPEGHIYYWNDGGHWRSGGRLPSHYVLHDENRERLQLHSRQPWTEHQSEHSGPEHSDEHH